MVIEEMVIFGVPWIDQMIKNWIIYTSRKTLTKCRVGGSVPSSKLYIYIIYIYSLLEIHWDSLSNGLQVP